MRKTDNKFELHPIDEDGKPTTYISYLILDLMFTEKRQHFTSLDVARRLAIRQDNIDLICNQLLSYDILTENPPKSGKYQYNLDSTNIELQTKLEKFLAYVKLEHIPVYRILDYSPSYRAPSIQ